jgi:hypothetical protein
MEYFMTKCMGGGGGYLRDDALDRNHAKPLAAAQDPYAAGSDSK